MSTQPWWCCCGDVPCEDQTLCDEIKRRIEEDDTLTPSERDELIAEFDRMCSGDFTGIEAVGINIVERDLTFACPCVTTVTRIERRERTSSYAINIDYHDGTPNVDHVGGGVLVDECDCSDGTLVSSVFTPRTVGVGITCTSPSPLVTTRSDPTTCSDNGQEYKEVRFACNNASTCPCSALSTIPSDGFDPCFDEVESPGAAMAVMGGPGGRLGELIRGGA